MATKTADERLEEKRRQEASARAALKEAHDVKAREAYEHAAAADDKLRQLETRARTAEYALAARLAEDKKTPPRRALRGAGRGRYGEVRAAGTRSSSVLRRFARRPASSGASEGRTSTRRAQSSSGRSTTCRRSSNKPDN